MSDTPFIPPDHEQRVMALESRVEELQAGARILVELLEHVAAVTRDMEPTPPTSPDRLRAEWLSIWHTTRDVRDCVADPVGLQLRAIAQDGDGMKLSVESRHWVQRLMARAFWDSFTGAGAQNWLETPFACDTPDGRQVLLVTLQRADRATPGMLRQRAEAEARRLALGLALYRLMRSIPAVDDTIALWESASGMLPPAELQALRAYIAELRDWPAVDGPELVDAVLAAADAILAPPPPKPEPRAEGPTDGCVIDGRTGSLRCCACGEEQKVPLPIDIDVFTALGRGFTELHKRCTTSER